MCRRRWLAAAWLFSLDYLVAALEPPRIARALLRSPGNAAETAAWYEKRFETTTRPVAESPESVDVVFAKSGFALRLSPSAPSDEYSLAPPDEGNGLLGVGIEMAAPTLGGDDDDEEVVVEELSVAAASVPDEDPSKLFSLSVARLDDPAGYPVYWVSGTATSNPSPKLVLCVSDLDESIEFYTRCLGMTLLRKRALVPDLAAMAGIVAYAAAPDAPGLTGPEAADEHSTPRIELRYVYGNDRVTPERGLAEIVVQCADPDATAATAELFGGRLADRPDDALVLTDPDGYSIHLEPITTTATEA